MSSDGGSGGGLTGIPLRNNFDFNWLFLVVLLVCGILSLFFLFYFNRLFATLVSYGLRAWSWHRYRVYIDIQALQISLLGGRVFFKGLRYHGNNETIFIHSGHVTWCYWLRNVREVDLGRHEGGAVKDPQSDPGQDEPNEKATNLSRAEGGGKDKAEKLPCRLNVSINGAEWFIYNRSAAYDAIIFGMTGEDQFQDSTVLDATMVTPNSKLRQRMLHSNNSSRSSKNHSTDGATLPSPVLPGEKLGQTPFNGDHPLRTTTTMKTEGSRLEDIPGADEDSSFFLRLLPIHIDCQKAAVVLGNEHTKSVLVAKAEKMSGEIDASSPTNPIDQYKQMFNFDFEQPLVQIKPNDDYKEDQTTAAIRVKRGAEEQIPPKKPHFYNHSFWHRQRKKAWHRLQDLVPRFRSSVESFSSSVNEQRTTEDHAIPGTQNWQGLSRYLEEGEKDDKARWSSIEYATVTTIADSPLARLSFYWDVVGTVPDKTNTLDQSIPPAWGINLSLKGAIINYGPWADRQRADLQRVFFPTLCKDSQPAKAPLPRQPRLPTQFKMYIELDDETILRVPIKEESKNWKWTKQADTMGAQNNHKKSKSRKRKVDKGESSETRPFGWLDVKVGPNASVSYAMDMMAGQTGFGNSLHLDLPKIEVTTSVNHGLLLKTVQNSISCDLSNPLQWNGHHTWVFNVFSKQLEIFLLREHIFLLIDLVDDWASGPSPEYLMFTPFRYIANLHLDDFQIFLNVNDANIINNPSDFEDNTFINIFGSVLDAKIDIPLDSYQAHRTDIPFEIDARDGGLKLHVPPWNTQATFLNSNVIATLQELLIDGVYQYCSTTSAKNTDALILNVHGNSPVAQIYGFVVRYYLKVKDNYFGEDIRFKTLEEYQESLRSRRDGIEETQTHPPFKKANDLDIILRLTADNTHARLPANFYSSKCHTNIEIASLALDLRFTSYYMDLDVEFKTLAFSQGFEDDGRLTPDSGTSKTEVFVDGINIYGNRLFGLPPTEPTYICNWDFSVGAVTGECTTDFLSAFAKGAQGVAFSFDDDENALPLISELLIHDVTFLRANIESVRVWLHVDNSAFLCSTGNIVINFNDCASAQFSGKLNFELPDLQLACVDAESASRHRSRTETPVHTHMLLQTSVSISMLQRKLGFASELQLQQEHIKYHDQRTNRTDFLLVPGLLDGTVPVATDPPAMCIPLLPEPIVEKFKEDQSFSSIVKSSMQRERFVSRKSSFLSVLSASQKSNSSVLRPRSVKSHGDALGNSRARTLHPDIRRGDKVPVRDVSTSTGRQSSFYSALGESRGLPPSTVTFSSSYIAPYFPLRNVNPDASELPSIVQASPDITRDRRQPSLNDNRPVNIDEGTEHTSFIVELPAGLRLVVNPKAVDAIAGVLEVFQPKTPTDILDSLQAEAVGEIFEANKKKMTGRKLNDLHIRTPGVSIRFLHPSDYTLSGAENDASDQYDVSVGEIAVTTRSETVAVVENVFHDAKNYSSVHLALGFLQFGAKERYDALDDPQAGADIVLRDVSFWMASRDERSINLKFKDLQITTASSKIEYMSSLIQRTKILSTTVAETFSSQLSRGSNRVQLFTYLVASLANQTLDPLFLARPSYVLRSADNHLRTHDSWKVAARMRHMYSSLDEEMQQQITSQCQNTAELPPPNARQTVLTAFNKWRSWDLNDVQECLIIKQVYGAAELSSSEVLQKVVPTKLTFNTKSVRLLLDPGPKQNEISMYNLSATAHSKPILSSTEECPDPNLAAGQVTVVQLNCPEIEVALNWELYELVDDSFKLYHQNKAKLPTEKTPTPPLENHISQSPPIRHDLHIAFATEKASITLDTINLKNSMAGSGLKGSFVLAQIENSEHLKMTTLLLAAENSTTKLISHSQDLMIYRLKSPSLFVSQEVQIIEGAPANVFKAAASSQQLSFSLLREIPVLIEVADVVLGDEIERVYRLIKSFPDRVPSQQPMIADSNASIPTKINIALFLDEYFISLPLLHSLVHEVSGVIARASVVAQLGTEIILDFDLKQNVHELKTIQSEPAKVISSLQIPPTNGRVISSMSDDETTMSIFASIELIEFDATALHGLTTAFNRPETSGIVSDIKDDIDALQGHIEEIFGQKEQTATTATTASPPNPNSSFVYDAHITWAGLKIYANAQADKRKHNSARLDFNIGCVQLLIANRLDGRGPILDFPEVRLGLRDTGLELTRWNRSIMEPCGSLSFSAFLSASSKVNDIGNEVRSFHVHSDGLEISLFPNTASSIVDIMGFLQDKIKDLDFTRERKYLRKLRQNNPRITVSDGGSQNSDTLSASTVIFASMYSLELLDIQVSWIVGTDGTEDPSYSDGENLVLSLKRVDLSTRRENAARLTITDLQVQMVPESHDKTQRSFNSALLPEVVFNVGYVSASNARRLAFQAAGKSLDLRLTSQFILPAARLQKSINSAVEKVRAASEPWMTPTVEQPTKDKPRKPFFGRKRMESLLVDADFAGAVVHLSGKKTSKATGLTSGRVPQAGKYGQFNNGDSNTSTILRSPGLAWKIEYKDNGLAEPSLNAEVKVNASNNILYPAVVPLIMEISSAIKEIVSDNDKDEYAPDTTQKSGPQKLLQVDDDNILAADPSIVLGRTNLNLGLKICRQEFSLSCQPIARVAAIAKFDDIYLTVNTVRSTEHGHFFAVTAAFTKLQVSVQHVYSRESTGSFDVDSVFLSLMNSKHVSGTSGLSAMLKISPMKVLVNAKQLQDFLLFRDIWVPPEVRRRTTTPTANPPAGHNSAVLVQKYQQVAATGAFPWNATISIAELDVQMDLGQAIGKSAFIISNFWISSKKNSDWEQNLCLGFDKVGVDSTGRMSGFVSLENFKLRTSIRWPAREMALNQTPLVQGSLAFSQFRVKAAFDYQAFLVADVTSFEFLMYNVRQQEQGKGDRLVAILDGDAVQLYCTTTSAAQTLALYQAFQRLVQEKRSNYEASLAEIEKFMKRKSVANLNLTPLPKAAMDETHKDKAGQSPISLHTDVLVTLKTLNIGAFPNTFTDHQVFKLEALNAQTRFAVIMDEGKIHSILGLTLGQLRIGLAGVKDIDGPKTVGDLRVEDVVRSATNSRGGTILKVPKVELIMQTWQIPNSNHIDYIFKSSFEGKVEVGWNYSRISYIRNMWASHSKALALKLGKPLPSSVVKITGVPGEDGEGEQEQQKITAEVNVPVSKYEYTALEPAVIETPQLRDMGEATPPLEWIGLHRDRLPNLTHQIVIVTLLEVASEVEEAYGKILGSS